MNPKSSVCLGILAFTLPAAAWSACDCGPTYCLDDSAFNAAIAGKKSKALADGAPARLVQLYDKLDHCTAAATTAPDGFSILFQNPANRSINVDGWTAENERNDAGATAGGKGACFVILARRAFACCGATPATERTDYNSALDLNTSDAIPCE